MPQAVFYTNEYELSHGSKPRGRGSWVFETRCQSAAQKAAILNVSAWPVAHKVMIHVEDTGSNKVQIWIRGSCLYTEAKSRVKNFLGDYFTLSILTVCP